MGYVIISRASLKLQKPYSPRRKRTITSEKMTGYTQFAISEE